MENYNVEDVFKTNGVPEITYVEPKEYNSLLVAVRTKGKCVVIEGPSGIGKTTAVNKVIEKLGLKSSILSARKSDDLTLIAKVALGEFSGITIIDDFHRLPSDVQSKISDVMKYLADEGDADRKIIVVGINRVGDSLVKFSPDLNNRISTIKFEANSDEKVLELIDKGEKALNINFNGKADIIKYSYGSFHIAQLMCQNSCVNNDVLQTQEAQKAVNFSYPKVSNSLVEEFSRSYFEVVRSFATGPRLRREGRAPYLHVLKWLAESETWSLSLTTAIQRHPDQKASVSQIIDKSYLTEFLKDKELINSYLHFDSGTCILAAEDPKFIFYLKAINWNNFAKDIGYIQLVEEPKYDYALSFAGSERRIAEKIYNKLSDQEISVFYDKNEQADILSQDVEEYLFPIYNSEALYVVPLMSKEYPNRVWTKFESKAFRNRFGENAVIPIWWSDANMGMFEVSKDYGGMNFNVDNNEDEQIDEIVTQLVKKIHIARVKKEK